MENLDFAALRMESAQPGGDIRISTDPAHLDLDWVAAALSERAYWALGRSRATIERSIAGSLCFTAHLGDRQVGFARVITDQATLAWVCDVFVDEEARGRGIGSALVAAVVADPRLDGLRMLLATRDAGPPIWRLARRARPVAATYHPQQSKAAV